MPPPLTSKLESTVSTCGGVEPRRHYQPLCKSLPLCTCPLPSSSHVGVSEVLPRGATLSNSQQLSSFCHRDPEGYPWVAGSDSGGQAQRGEKRKCSSQDSGRSVKLHTHIVRVHKVQVNNYLMLHKITSQLSEAFWSGAGTNEPYN